MIPETIELTTAAMESLKSVSYSRNDLISSTLIITLIFLSFDVFSWRRTCRRGRGVCRLRVGHCGPLPPAGERAFLARDVRQVCRVPDHAHRHLLLPGPPPLLQARLREVRDAPEDALTSFSDQIHTSSPNRAHTHFIISITGWEVCFIKLQKASENAIITFTQYVPLFYCIETL